MEPEAKLLPPEEERGGDVPAKVPDLLVVIPGYAKRSALFFSEESV